MSGSMTLAAGSPIDHVVNHGFWYSQGGWWLWSANMTMLILSGIICILVGLWAAKKIDTGGEGEGNDRYVTKNPFAHTLEVMCIYLRDEVCRPLLGDKVDRGMMMPFLWTLFFFILTNNLLGLVPLLDIAHLINPDWKKAHVSPIGGTATQNIFVTGALAVVAALVINFSGVRELGIKGYIGHLTGGAPWYIWPILVPVEIAGIAIKPIALAIRLFANMTAGHVLVATLFMFVGLGVAAGGALALAIPAISIVGAFAIYFLEIFVAFLQAFVFMFLTAVFIAQLQHHDHEHEEGHAAAAH